MNECLGLACAAKARTIKAGSTLQEKLDLEQMRARLLADIQKFNADARRYIPAIALAEERAVSYDTSMTGSDWDAYEDTASEQGSVTAASNSSNPEIAVPEQVVIPLPSTCNLGGYISPDYTATVA